MPHGGHRKDLAGNGRPSQKAAGPEGARHVPGDGGQVLFLVPTPGWMTPTARYTGPVVQLDWSQNAPVELVWAGGMMLSSAALTGWHEGDSCTTTYCSMACAVAPGARLTTLDLPALHCADLPSW